MAKDFLGQVTFKAPVVADTAATVGLVVQGAASQSADLTEWQNNAGTILAKVDSAGNITGTSFTGAVAQSQVTGLSTALAALPTNADIASLVGQSATVIDAFDRRQLGSGGTQVTSGTVYFTFFSTPQDMTVSQITMLTGTTNSSAGVTLARMGLYTWNGTTATLVARTASDTTLFVNALNANTRAFNTTGGYPATYTLTAGVRYAVAMIQVCTTGSYIQMQSGGSTAGALEPRLGGVVLAQSDLPTTVTTFSAVGSTYPMPFARLS